MSGEFYGPGGPACTPDDADHEPAARAQGPGAGTEAESAAAGRDAASPAPRGKGSAQQISQGARRASVPEREEGPPWRSTSS